MCKNFRWSKNGDGLSGGRNDNDANIFFIARVRVAIYYYNLLCGGNQERNLHDVKVAYDAYKHQELCKFVANSTFNFRQ